MTSVRQKIEQMGLWLPEKMKLPSTVELPFESIHIVGNQAYISGHLALEKDGSLMQRFGRVGDNITTEEAYDYAKFVGLSMLASLERAIGELDRVRQWVKVLGMVNGSVDFYQQPAVINGFSDLILKLYGEKGKHSRSAIGVGGLPFNAPVEIEAMLLID